MPVPAWRGACCGFVLLAAAMAYWLLQQAIIAAQGQDSILQHAIGGDWKGKVSPLLYLAGILLTFVSAWLAQLVYLAVAIPWLTPDRRIERILEDEA